MGKFVGKRVVPRHAGVWSNRKAYEPLEIVLEESTGDSYISRKDVPAGTALSQEDYWALCQRFSEQMQLFRNAVDQDVAGMHTLTNNTVRDINQSLADTEESITTKLGNTEQAVEERTSEAESKLAQGKTQMEQTAAALNARMDGIVAGSTGEGDVEVADIRTDSSGKNYTTAGDAVRSITAGLPEKFDFTDKNAIRNNDTQTSQVEIINRTAHFTFDYTGTGYVGCFLRLGKHDDLKGKRLMAVYQNTGVSVKGTGLITNSRGSWGSLNGSVVAQSIGRVDLNEENGFFQEILVDFNTEVLDGLLEQKPEDTFYLVFKLENTGAVQAGELYIYAYDPDAISDLFWKYYAGSEKIRQIMAEVIAARTDSRGVEYGSIGERMSIVDSMIVPALPIAQVVAPRDNNKGYLESEDGGFSAVKNPTSAVFVFDYNEYTAMDGIDWGSLHVNLGIRKSFFEGLNSLENVVLQLRLDGLGENKHIGEKTPFYYYINAVGSWSRLVNPMSSAQIQIGLDNVIPITETQIRNVLDDAAGGSLFYIPVVMSCFNKAVIADMGRIQFTMSVADMSRISLDGYIIYADSATSALTANTAGSAAQADEADHAVMADYASGAGSAVMADNFFITTPDDLLNEEGKRYSPGLNTTDIPTAPVVQMTAGGQCVPDWRPTKTTDGIHQTYELIMGLNNTSSQVQNQGYQKNIGNALSMETILRKFIDGYQDFFVVTVEDCEKYPEGTTTGSYSQTYLLATFIIAENKSDSLCSRRPVLTRELGSGKKMYLWKCTVDVEKAQTHLNGMTDGTRRLYWNGIWHTRHCETEETKYWTVYWYWLDYAFTDGSYTDEDMMNFFINKYMYWGSNVNHQLIGKRFKELDEMDGRVDALETDMEALKERVPIPDASGPKIVCWGDSLTAGGGWTTTLAQLAGGTVYNGGTGGENARTIMARQGADVMTINHITIPAACEPVTIAVRATDGGIMTEAGKKVTPLLQGGAHVNPVMIGDVEGTLRWTGSNYADQTGIWTFTRSAPGEEVEIDRPTAIRTNFDRIHNAKDEIMVIFMGQNGGYSGNDDLIDMHRKMIDHFKGKEYVILGLSSGTAAQRTDYETAMKNAFGRRFISLREYLAAPIYDGEGNIVSCYGLADQGLEPGSKEYNGTTYVALEEIAQGIVPHQIITDSVHYTAGTKTVIGTMLYKKMKELGILE